MEQRVQEQAELDEIWDGDLLGRARDAEFLQRFLEDMALRRATSGGGSYVLNIDAEWGSGKTFFMDRFARQLQHSGHLVARVNAWRDDHMDDPFTSVLFAIDEALSPVIEKEASPAKETWEFITNKMVPVIVRATTGATKAFIRKKIGSELEDILSSEADENDDLIREVVKSGSQEVTIEIENVIDRSSKKLINAFKRQSASSELFRVKLGRVVEQLHISTGALMFVLVDELDRCRPSYAVALLERVKHLFDAPKVVFVFATDSGQLRHSISGAYGPGFDGFGYLGRFFDRTYKFPQPNIGEIVAVEAADIDFDKTRCPIESKTAFLSEVFDAYGLTPRGTLRVIDIIRSTVAAWPYPVPLDLVILAPMVVQFYRTGEVGWESEVLIPSTLVLQLGRMLHPVRHEIVDEKFQVARAFDLLKENVHNVRRAINLGHGDGITFERAYAYETFSLEINRPRSTQGSSIQHQIPALIQHAGRILDTAAVDGR